VPESLYIRLHDDSSEVNWVTLDQDGRRTSVARRGSLAEAGSDAEGRRVVVLVPGTQVITTSASVPVRSLARLQQVLPYSLEESLAQDVEQLLFAAGPRTAAGAVAVSVVAKERMEAWLERVREAGLTPSAVYADSEGVPDTPGTLTLIMEGERIYGRRSGQPPFVFEDLSLESLLDLLKGGEAITSEDTADLERVLVYTEQNSHGRYEQQLAALREQVGSLDIRLLEDTALAHIAATLCNHPGANLLQGPYAPKSDWVALLRPWRFAAALLAVLVGVGFVSQGALYLMLRHQDRAITERATAACQGFSARLGDCRAEVDRRLAAAGQQAAPSDQQFLTMLAAVAQARAGGSRVTSLSFRNGVMNLRMTAPSVPALDEFAKKISDSKQLQARIQSANQTDQGVEGQLQIGGEEE
jgi:general secretion pathway protein L